MSIIDRVIVLGDSYTFGHGCSDRVYYYDEDLEKFVGDITPMNQCIPSEYCWPALLQKEFPNLTVHNLSQPGHCNQGMFRDLLDFYVKFNYYSLNDLIIFNGTFSNRIEVRTVHDLDKVGSWAIAWEYMATGNNHFKEYANAQKYYTKYLYHEKIGINLTLSSLLGAYSYTTLNKHNFLYSLPDSPHPSIIPNVRCITNHEITPIFEYDFSGEDNYQFNVTCQAKDTHTNEKGHQIYYEKEIKPRIQKMI